MRSARRIESAGRAGVPCRRAGAFANELTKWSRPLGWMLLAIFYVALCVNYEGVCRWCGRFELIALASARSWRIR